MPPAAPRTRSNSFNSTSLIRFLSGLDSATDVADAPQTLAERLSLWMGWTDAIALSAALNPATAAPPGKAGKAGMGAAPGLAAAVQRLVDGNARMRLQLAQNIQCDALLAVKPVATGSAPTRPRTPPPDLSEVGDFAPFRRQYQAHQRAMETAIAPLRAQLRAALTGGTPAQARLAALDAVLEQALETRERQLLATVPSWLEKHFGRLRQRHLAQAPAVVPEAATATHAPPWWPRCGPDLQTVLMAELDLRCLPLQGLLAAANPTPTNPTP